MSTFVQQLEIADPIVLDVIDRPDPHAGPGQVRVRVRAAGLNPVDWKVASIPAAAARYGVTAPTGFGHDFAGEIDEVGPGVEGFAIGDRVFGGARARAVAEHVVVTVATDLLVRTPDGLSDEAAGALSIVARTADAAVTAVGASAGDTVLIGGAAGGVGVLVVQLAVAAGAKVIATASESNHAFLRDLGATPTTYGDGLAERVRALAPGGVDAAIDLQGTDTVLTALDLGVDPRPHRHHRGWTEPAGRRGRDRGCSCSSRRPRAHRAGPRGWTPHPADRGDIPDRAHLRGRDAAARRSRPRQGRRHRLRA